MDLMTTSLIETSVGGKHCVVKQQNSADALENNPFKVGILCCINYDRVRLSVIADNRKPSDGKRKALSLRCYQLSGRAKSRP